MYYPDELIEEVRSRNDIVDVISGYVHLTKKGSNYFGLCPFHSEKSASFSVSGSRQMYKCFGCGAGGNVYTFVMNYENFTFPEAVKMLADRVGVSLPEAEYTEEMKKKESRRAKLLEVNKEAAKYFYYLLRNEKGALGHRYLSERRLSEETMKQFGLGFANVTSNDLVLYLKSKGYTDDLIIEAGLASHDERYGTHDKFWNRVMFPIQDINHRVIGFGGRVMGDGKPKYLNSPETPIFDKSRNLYGLNFARTSRKNNIILCEGYMDVISMHQAGFNQAVASLGTAFTSGQANILRKYTSEVLLAYDSDSAGVKAALRAIEILREVGLSGKVINMEPYKDPDEFIKNLGTDAFQERIENAENSFMFEIRMKEREFDLKDPDGKTRFYREIAKKLCEFSEEMERENYLAAVCDAYQIGYDNLRKLVHSYAQQTGIATPIARPKSGIFDDGKKKAYDGVMETQKLFITWLTENPYLFTAVDKYIKPADFIDETYRKVADMLWDELPKGICNPAAIISRFEDEEEQSKVAGLFQTKLPEKERIEEKEKEFNDLLYTLKNNSFQHYSASAGTDMEALNEVIKGKTALQELKKVHIHLQQDV